MAQSDMAKGTKAWACYDCGKCTATCPVSRAGADYSPRRHVLAAGRGAFDGNDGGGDLGSCLTCGLCDLRCPVQVDYTSLVRRLRESAYRPDAEMECPHGGALQSTMRMMAKGGAKQNRLTWVTDDLKISREKGHLFYWAGCAVYYDAFFPKQEPRLVAGNEAAVRLLNLLHFTPVVSPEERCCGHDLLWNGDRENFEKLARHNVALVESSGADTLVTSCAECLRTWKIDYAPFLEGKSLKILHITELLNEHASQLTFEGNGKRRITYQDPCRLGRHLGIYDPPRRLLEAVPGVELVEMARNRHNATCCAGGTWSNCDRFAKKIQVDRLREARATGAEVLATACPKCQIHLSCAMKDPNLGQDVAVEMRDVAQIILESLSISRPVEPSSRGKGPRREDS